MLFEYYREISFYSIVPIVKSLKKNFLKILRDRCIKK